MPGHDAPFVKGTGEYRNIFLLEVGRSITRKNIDCIRLYWLTIITFRSGLFQTLKRLVFHAMTELSVSEEYSERYCAYVDILGFAELIDRLSLGETPFHALRTLLRTIHETPARDLQDDFTDSDFRAQSISDAVAISTAPNENGLLHLFYTLEELAIRLLADGFFLRGAIVKGKLYHDDKMVFGEALVRSFQLEQSVVRYPRLMLTSEIVEDVQNAKERKEDFKNWIVNSEDGPRFLNIFNTARLAIAELDKDSRQNQIDFCNDLASQIDRRLKESFDQPSHFEKVRWFAKFWNKSFDRCGGELKRIRGAGVDPEPAFWG